MNKIKNTLNRIFEYANRKPLICSLIISTIISVIFLSGKGYQIDNQLMSIILNGGYGNDNFCFFVNYWFAYLIKIIDALVPAADGYMLIFRILSWAELWIVNYLILKYEKNIVKICIYFSITAIFITVFNGVDIANQNFTMIATSAAIVSSICMVVMLRRSYSVKLTVIAVILMFFGLSIRISSAELVVPFVGTLFVAEFFKTKNKKECLIRIIKIVLPIAICFAALSIVKNNTENGEKYGEFVEKNRYRATIIDYPLKDYEVVKDKLGEITENDYMSLSEYTFLLDTDRINREALKSIVDNARDTTGNKIGFKNMIISGSAETIKKFGLVQCGIFFLMFLYVVLGRKNIWDKIAAVLCIVGAYVICIYFYNKGRLVNHVTLPIALILLSTFAMLLFTNEKGEVKAINYFRAFIGGIIAVYSLTCLVGCIGRMNGLYFASTAKINNDEGIYKELCEGDNIYIWTNNDLYQGPYKHFKGNFKLPSKAFMEHNFEEGQYWYYSPYQKEYFERIGITNPLTDLLTKTNVYYISSDKEHLDTYIKEHYDETIEPKAVGEIGEATIWSYAR